MLRTTTTSRFFLGLFFIISTGRFINGKPCEILENMSCECHSSSNNQTEQLKCTNFYTPINGTIKLTNFTSRSFDSFHLTFHTREFNVTSMFINELSYLFARSADIRQQQQTTIKIILTFQDYIQLHFEDYSFYQLFGHQSSGKTSLSLELTSSGQITFASMAFQQLVVDQMAIHVSSLEPYSFEELFNNTQIGSLAIEGCTPRSNVTLRRYFNGKIRLGKITKMAEIVSSEEFPMYPVSSMTIEVHEPRKINASTFIGYQNLNGVHLIRPKFFFDNRSFDGFQYLPNLETLELDAETIKANTFQHVMRIRYFTLGPNIRYLSDRSFDHLDYLSRFDASKVILDNLYPTSKCILARYVHKQHQKNPGMIISPPQAEFCDCVYDFILHLLKRKPENSYTEQCRPNQQERCQLNECDLVRNFRLPTQQNQPNHPSAPIIPSIDENFIDSSIQLYPVEDPVVRTSSNPTTTTHRSSTNPPPVYHHQPSPYVDDEYDGTNGSSFADTQKSNSQKNKSFDSNPNPLDNDKSGQTQSHLTIPKSRTFTDGEQEKHRLTKKAFTFKWISLSLLSITISSVLLVAMFVWYFTCRSSKRRDKKGFQPVPPTSTSV